MKNLMFQIDPHVCCIAICVPVVERVNPDALVLLRFPVNDIEDLAIVVELDSKGWCAVKSSGTVVPYFDKGDLNAKPPLVVAVIVESF